MKIPFWEPSREYRKYKSEIDQAIQGCLERGELVLGYLDQITNFEKSFAEFIGVKHAIMVGCGTQALHTAYQAVGIGPGDEVITTSHTFIATIDQIVARGAKPILVDIDPETGLIDPKEIAKVFTEKTKAIVPVHLEGKVCDKYPHMRYMVNGHEIPIIEDAAQAIGAKGVGYGLAQCYSLYPAKILGCVGNAGMVTTNDDDIAEKSKMIRCNYNIGRANKDVANAEYGHNFEPDAIQAAVLNAKMKYLPERLEKRQEIAEYYDDEFKDLPIIKPLKQEGRVYQDYVLRSGEREEIVKFLKDQGIGIIGDGLLPNHWYQKLNLNYTLPYTEDYLAKQFRIPCNPDLEDAEIEYIAEKVKEFYA